MNWYLEALRKYATFNGRSRRKEYWMFALFNFIFIFAAMILDNLLGLTFKIYGVSLGYGILYAIYALFVFIPGLAISVRRLHDLDKSGAWYFIILVPLIGSIWFLILLCTEGTRGANNYGEDPKGNVGYDFVRPVPNVAVNNQPNINRVAMSSANSNQQNKEFVNQNVVIANPVSAYIVGLTGTFAGQKFILSNKVTFGRDPQNCNIIFPIEQPGISSIHCAIISDRNGVFLADLGSTYGTYLQNGTKLIPNQSIKLNNKDVFYLTSEECKFEVRIG
jgi:uncharacterized membrane protein YhaH (DUF805 family)